MQIKVTRIKALDQYKLELTFNDGTCGVADLGADLVGSLAALRDPELWKQVHLRRGVVTWNDALDLAPEFLYAKLKPKMRVGDHVSFTIGQTIFHARVVEDRGALGVGGRQLVCIEVLNADEPRQFEMPADELMRSSPNVNWPVAARLFKLGG